MQFKSTADAFTYWNAKTTQEIEARAAEIKAEVARDPRADVAALNIEIDGLAQAKANHAETRAASLITSATFGASHEASHGDVLASAEYRSAFFKSLMGRELEAPEQAALDRARMERRADSFATTTSAAAVIPTQTLDEIVSKARDLGGIISVARQFNVPAGLEVPVATPTAAASWNTEGKAVDSEAPSVVPTAFAPHEILKVLSISAAVRKMSVSAFESYLVDELTASVMACIAKALIDGTGSKQGTGLANGVTWDATNTVTVAAGSSVAYADIVSLMAMLHRGYSANAKFAMNQSTLLNQVYSLTDDNKRPIFLQDLQNEAVGKILGHEVILDDFMPDGLIYYGDFAYLGFNLADGIAVESSTESSFKSGRIDYRAMAIADTKPIVAEAFAKLEIASE